MNHKKLLMHRKKVTFIIEMKNQIFINNGIEGLIIYLYLEKSGQ